MFCSNCGNQVSENAKFCSNCGTAMLTVPLKPHCPSCGAECESDMVYCEECGTRISGISSASPVQSSSNSDSEKDGYSETQFNQRTAAPVREAALAYAQAAPSNNVLKSVLVSWYRGDKKIGVADATGMLRVYADRIEFDKKMGNSAATLSLVGTAISAVKASKEANMVFRMDQISSARESTYGGIYPAMVIQLKNGEVNTFAGVASRSSIRSCIQLINNNKR